MFRQYKSTRRYVLYYVAAMLQADCTALQLWRAAQRSDGPDRCGQVGVLAWRLLASQATGISGTPAIGWENIISKSDHLFFFLSPPPFHPPLDSVRCGTPVPSLEMASIQLGMRRLAAPLANTAFVCRQCLRQQKLPPPPTRRVAQLTGRSRSYATRSPAPSPSPLSALSSQISTTAVRSSSTVAAAAAATTSSSATGAAAAAAAAAKNGRPEVASKAVAYWLLGSAASVFGIVVFGGLTRLTESGYYFSFPQSTTNPPLTVSLPEYIRT